MVVEKLKEREDKRDAQQDEQNLIHENERLKTLNSELLHENDKLSLSFKNAQEQYTKLLEFSKEQDARIEYLEKALRYSREIAVWILNWSIDLKKLMDSVHGEEWNW